MKSKQIGQFVIRTLPLLISAAFATNAFAQSGAEEEVIVSAQKRPERLRDVPMSISAITGQALENRKIEGAADLQGVVPNLNIVAAPVSGLISATSIRGLGTGQPSIWMDPAIGMYVDGVFVGKNQGALFDLVDLERVEVLRGPQGTLFGRNTPWAVRSTSSLANLAANCLVKQALRSVTTTDKFKRFQSIHPRSTTHSA